MTCLETELEGRPCGELLESCIPVLETERLVLRAPRFEDARAIAAVADDRRIAEMTANLPHPYAEKHAENWIANAWSGPDHPFLITLKTNGAPIGATGFVMPELGDPEIGYWLATAHWGKGYATEAARAVVDHLFTQHGVAAVAASARVVNPGSRRVIEKCGFQWIGVGLMRSRLLASSVPVDKFRLDRSTWASIKAWRDPILRRSVPEGLTD
ncbi:GNAT family N-acetyltransferase [Phreatobacter aquaticus]|uniref:GNAT family N-acetyltransferase n=1 Tax=Phreatobacter aquaticus TaxID=2570229 RepID=A0A4D7QAX6_9HYPH|nr:GNAT family N-acetyltransferase [Phreatobacter aquaticus]QCK85220.1 GNAT family N-acetyltransferase [Phreatobacter aquaticus]